MMNVKINDNVKVYKKILFFNITIKTMYGVIEKAEEWIQLDNWGEQEIECYKISVLVGNKKIIITDYHTPSSIFRYEFDTI